MTIDPITKIAETQRVINTLEHSQWKSPAEIIPRQLKRLEQLLIHAKKTVPLYQKHLADVQLDKIFPLTTESFRNIPILSRTQAQKAKENLVSTDCAHMPYLYKLETSGSTGVAVKLLGNIETAIYWQALSMRDHQWHKRDLTKTLAAIRWLEKGKAMHPDGATHPHWDDATHELVQTGTSHVLNVIASTEQQIEWLLRIKPNYLLTFPSQLKVLAHYCLDHDIQFPELLEVRTVGESVSDDLRELVKLAWKVELIDAYSSEEFGFIAIQCPEHPHYHIQSESVYCEVLDEHNLPCVPGQTGRLVITSLHNFVTPLIRYEIGDYATVGERCSCRRDALPVLKRIDGRRRNRLILPSGESRFPYLGEREESQSISTAIKQFQFVQHDTNRIELKLVVSEPLSKNQELRYQKFVQNNFGYPFDVQITYHEHIERLPNGKYEEFISHVGL